MTIMKHMRKKINRLLDFSFSSRVTLILFAEILLGASIILVTTYLLADLTKDTLFDKTVLQFDTNISKYFYTLRTPLLTQVMIIISQLGADFILAVSTLILIFFTWKKHKEESILFFIMLIFGAFLNILLKDIFQRPRPTLDPLLTISSYSFPSGHAMNSFVFYVAVSYFIYHFTRNIKLGFIAVSFSVLLIFLIGISRIYLGVHYPSDVLAGYLTGLLWFVLVLVLERTMIFFKLYRNYKSPK